MHRTMMLAAEWDRELIADLAAKRARLHKSDVMRVRWLAAAQQAGFLHHKAKVIPVAISPRRRHRQHALIDAHLISAGFIHLASLLTPSAETFRRSNAHDLSAFGRQELG